MMSYPGLPRPQIGAFLDHEASRSRYQDRAEFYLGKVDMVCNIGTYLDSPFHRYRNGSDLSQIPLDMVAGVPGIILDGKAEPNRSIVLGEPSSELTGRSRTHPNRVGQTLGNKELLGNLDPYLSGEVRRSSRRIESCSRGCRFLERR